MKAAILGVALLSMGACCDQADIERRKIALEEQKYRDEQAAKTAAAQREQDERMLQEGQWDACRADAEDAPARVRSSPVPRFVDSRITGVPGE